MVRMLVTRPEPDASETAAKLRALDIEPLVEPLLTFAALPAPLPDAQGFAAMAVTSGNALRAIEARGNVAACRHLPLYCVGDRTAAAARALGFAQVISADGAASDLVRTIADAGLSGPVLYPAARERAGNLAKALARHGIMVITVPVYEMTPIAALSVSVRTKLDVGAIDAALFYSRRTAETFIEIASGVVPEPVAMLCLSEAVAEPLLKAHFVRVGLADHPSEEAMLSLALSFARDQNVGMITQ